MNDINILHNKITISGNPYYRVTAFVPLLMSLFGLFMLFDLEPGEPIVSYLFIIVFICFALWMSYSGHKEGSKNLELSSDGLCFRMLKSENRLMWEDINDWGISYLDSGKGGVVYEFYFSTVPLKTKNAKKKVVKGNVIFIQFFEKDCKLLLDTIVPYCKQYTSVEPFISARLTR